MVWHNKDQGHLTLTIHVDASVQGIGIWFLSEKRGYQCRLPSGALTGAIFFFEALAVCCTIHLVTMLCHVTDVKTLVLLVIVLD